MIQRDDVLVYYAVGHRAANFRWFAKSLATLRRFHAGPVAVLCDRAMRVASPDVTVYRWPMPMVLDAMIARACILEVLPRVPRMLCYVDTDTAFGRSPEKMFDDFAAPGFYASVEPKCVCFIGSPVSGECSLTPKELRFAQEKKNRVGSVCSGVFVVDGLTATAAFRAWRDATAVMAARFPDLVAAADWRTGDQATLNALVFRKQLVVTPAPWEHIRNFAPPCGYYPAGRSPTILHFAGDAAVKRNQSTYPGAPVALAFESDDLDPETPELLAAAAS